MNQARSEIEVKVRENSIRDQQDIAAGLGGMYRYVTACYGGLNRITRIALYRKSEGQGPVTLKDAIKAGFNRVTGDINQGRGGDFCTSSIAWRGSGGVRQESLAYLRNDFLYLMLLFTVLNTIFCTPSH